MLQKTKRLLYTPTTVRRFTESFEILIQAHSHHSFVTSAIIDTHCKLKRPSRLLKVEEKVISNHASVDTSYIELV